MTVHEVYNPRKYSCPFANTTFEIRKFECAQGSNFLQHDNSIVLNIIMFRGPVSDNIKIKPNFSDWIEYEINGNEFASIFTNCHRLWHWGALSNPTYVGNNAVNGNVPVMILGMVLVDVTHPSRHAVIAFVDVKVFVPKLMEIRIREQILLKLIINGFP